MEFYDSQLYLLLTWLYALWQWIRCNKIIICLILLMTGLLAQPFTGETCIRRGDRVCTVVKGKNDSREWDDDILFLDPWDDVQNTLVFGHQRHLIGSCNQFLELSRGRLLFTTHSMLCSIKRLEGMEFVLEHTPIIIGKLSTARAISDEDAIELLANGHCAVICSGESVITSSYSEASKCHLNFSMLATIPLVLQVKGFNLAACIASLAILILDLCRTPISKVYSTLRDGVMMWVKLNIMRSWSKAYEIMGIFSSSWMYSDRVEKCAYKSKGPFCCIFGSILNKESFTECDDTDGLDNMFKIEGDRAQWLHTLIDINIGAVFRFNHEIIVV